MRVIDIVKILHFLLFFDTGKYGNTVRSLINFGMQGFPCRSGSICHTRCTPVKEKPDLRVDWVAIVLCHCTEKVDESVFVKA